MVTVNITSEDFMNAFRRETVDYFIEQKNGRYGNQSIYNKAIILFTALCINWWVLYIMAPPIYIAILLAITLGAIKAGIGFNIMHDALHGSFRDDRKPIKVFGYSLKLNKVLGYSLDLLGGDHRVWKWQHNENHHPHTNVSGQDHDIDLGKLGRLSPEDPRLWFHKYQHIYIWFLYGLSYIGWKYIFDYGKAKKMGWSGKKIFLMYIKKFFVNYVPFTILPFVLCPWQYALTIVFVADFACGLITSTVFQLAHVVEKTKMYPASEKLVDYDVLHQIKTTADFGTKSKFLFWYLGGLNFQIEHHLAYGTSHVHYQVLHKAFLQTCRRFGVESIVFKNMWQAILSHQRQLKKLGQPDLAERAMFT